MKKKLKKISYYLSNIHIIRVIINIVLIIRNRINDCYKTTKLHKMKPLRSKGLLALRKYKHGEEKCIGCNLCSAICPTNAIKMHTVSTAELMPEITQFEIDLFKCVNCGWCEQACPVEAIVHTNMQEYHFTARGQQIITKEKLLVIGEKYENIIIESRKYDVID